MIEIISLMRVMAGLVIAISVALIVFSGLRYIISSTEGGSDSGKAGILYGATGLMLGMFSIVISSVFSTGVVSSSETQSEHQSEFSEVKNVQGTQVKILVGKSTVLDYREVTSNGDSDKEENEEMQTETNHHFYCEVKDSSTDTVYYSALKTKQEADETCDRFPEGMTQSFHYKALDGIYYIVD